jgi:hypothetical protein
MSALRQPEESRLNEEKSSYWPRINANRSEMFQSFIPRKFATGFACVSARNSAAERGVYLCIIEHERAAWHDLRTRREFDYFRRDVRLRMEQTNRPLPLLLCVSKVVGLLQLRKILFPEFRLWLLLRWTLCFCGT